MRTKKRMLLLVCVSVSLWLMDRDEPQRRDTEKREKKGGGRISGRFRDRSFAATRRSASRLRLSSSSDQLLHRLRQRASADTTAARRSFPHHRFSTRRDL